MRKLICALAVLAVLLSVGIPAAFAAHRSYARRCEAEAVCFVDADRDGVCDNYGDCSPDCTGPAEAGGFCHRQTVQNREHHGTHGRHGCKR